MTFVDIIIILVLVVVIGLVVYYSFIKNKGNKCACCSYNKSCNKSSCNIKGDQ